MGFVRVPQAVSNLRLVHKILGGFVVVLALMAVVAGVGIYQLEQAAQRADRMYAINTLGVQYSLQAIRYLNASARDEKKALLAAEAGQRNRAIDASRDFLAKAQQELENYRPTISSKDEADLFLLIEELAQRVVAGRTQVLDQAAKGDQVGAVITASQIEADAQRLNDNLDLLARYNAEQSQKAAKQSDTAAANARMLLIGLTVAAVVLGFGGAWWLARSIAGAARKAADAADRIAKGDVEVSVDIHSKDELGQMARSFENMTAYLREMVGVAKEVANGNLAVQVTPRGYQDALGRALRDMVENLAKLVGTVQENAQAIFAASSQLEESSNQMALATGQIAQAINEVTTSTVTLNTLAQDSTHEVTQLAAGSQQLSASAQSSAQSAAEGQREAEAMGQRIAHASEVSAEVARAAEASREAAVQGQQAVAQAVAAMESIAAAVGRASERVSELGQLGQQIGDIVKVIDEIASQTNLLALNAAIEAARAGEQGRGFAVVAENVRGLAERSSASTREIAELIARVQQGTREAVNAMAEGVRDVTAGREITQHAGQSLEAIIQAVQSAAERMNEVAGEVQELARGATRIVEATESIAQVSRDSAAGAAEMASGTERVAMVISQVSVTSEQTSASAEQVSASTEELSAQSEELAATASQMREYAKALSEAAARFRLAQG
ncbi:methyl-accepting chemotaxis protein [Tepidiforma flava]|uniref:Methyl-accepting chemotaxis protein n=1 Tax=Tepidiforma flava TaxID=3004094 RepID=A0ABY7M9K4_9CHLR|nr:methyl-accepting chemotaxis protein [Tepidiforma flava]WBL37237.1 methyl-accepting chemotaxis protein [Tepidiforma flava]